MKARLDLSWLVEGSFRIVLVLVAAGLATGGAHGDEPPARASVSIPWPAEVEGWSAPRAGEHPRLFFRRGDLPALRARAETAEGKAIIARLRYLLDGAGGDTMPSLKSPMTSASGKEGGPKPGGNELPAGTYSMSHAAGYGLLYQLTGETRYADLGRECFEWAFDGVRDRDREGRYSWKSPGGALRAGPSLGWYAVGYDLCYDGWDEAFRTKVAKAICEYDQGANQSIEELARGSRHMPASNHWGMQVGGAALALLAIRGDPGADAERIETLLMESEKAMIRNLTEGFGDHGWFAEGDGTGSMSSHIVFASALSAWKVAGGKDFISPRPNAPWMTLKWIFLTVPRGASMDFPKRGAYPHNVWDRDGLSGAGYFAQGFGAVTEEQKCALLWFYNRHLKALDEKAGTPFDTTSVYPHNSVLAFVNWPFGRNECNPATVIPRAVRDEANGFYMFRNRWRDEDDIVVSVQTRSTRGWHKANTDGRIEVWGLGRKTSWGRLKTEVTLFRPEPDGSALLTGADGTSLAVDFSGASGADALLAMTGPGAPKDDAIDVGDASVSLLVLSKGGRPEPRVEGNTIVIGDRTVTVQDGAIALGR